MTAPQPSYYTPPGGWSLSTRFNPNYAGVYSKGLDDKAKEQLGRYVEIYKGGGSSEAGPEPVPANYDFTSGATQGTESAADYLLSNWGKIQPILEESQVRQAQIQDWLNQRQYASMYPWLSRVAQEATARNLKVSKEFLAAKATTPGAIQDIMASKQLQASSAAEAEALRGQAMATQQQAATQMATAGLYRPYIG